MKTKNRVILTVSLYLTLLGLAVVWSAKQPLSAADPTSTQRPSPQVANQAVNDKVVAANTRLTFKLFSEILKQHDNENIFISPVGVASALDIVYNGASGQTQQAIAQTLDVQGVNIQEINQANAALKATLRNPDPKVQLSTANSLWVKQDKPFKPEFTKLIQNFYQAEVRTTNFGNPTTPSMINDWVKQSTNGKIDTIVDGIEPGTVFILLNAIYFKGNWTTPFPKQATDTAAFTLLDGTQKQIPMMHQQKSGNFPYYENELFQAVSLPYGQGRLSMYIFLPNQEVSLKTFYEKLNADNWQTWINQFDASGEEVTLSLPRFKLEYAIDLKDVLKVLGMEVAFRKEANFSAMSTSPLWIDKIKHKTFVEVDEEGTEAGAVTQVGTTRSGAINMNVNRPFFFAIRDNQTGSLLFLGSIIEPKEE